MIDTKPRPNDLLRRQRKLRGWSLEKVAELIHQRGGGADAKLVGKWERGAVTPRPYYQEMLCEIYGVTTDLLGFIAFQVYEARQTEPDNDSHQLTRQELGFYEEVSAEYYTHEPSTLEALCTDLEFRAQCVIYEALFRRTPLTDLRRKLAGLLTGGTTMDLERRKILRHIALLPIQVFGLSAVMGSSRSFAPEDILIHCASGITACEQLAQGVDLDLAYRAALAYVPVLKNIAHDSPTARRDAATLTTQAMLLLTALALHLSGSKPALGYARQAVSFSEVSEDAELRLTALGQLAWIYSSDKQFHKALETASQAEHLLKSEKQVHPLVISNTHAVYGAYSAQNGRRDDALSAMRLASQQFFAAPASADYAYMEFDENELALTWALVHARTGHPEDALTSFSDILDPSTLVPKKVVSERVRVEVLNHMATAAVKSAKKDMELAIHYWRAGLAGAKSLHSEQRFGEAVITFEIMDGIWSGEPRVAALREQLIHW